MIILGIETSCDETAVGVVTDDKEPSRRVLANLVASQFDEHRPYGGVVPEIAARAHLDRLDNLISTALRQSGIGFNDLDGIAATCGPGLIGGVMVGAMTGKAIAAVKKIPFLAINHLEAHALTARLTDDVSFPFLLLLVSGGHCQLLLVSGVGSYRRLGGTMDDAAGECFDKSAKLLGVGYPGGPMIEKAAALGNATAYDLPRPLLGRPGCDFSFSGLKTALRLLIEGRSRMKPNANFVADVASSLQAAITDIVIDRTAHAFAMLKAQMPPVTALVAAGGVAANGRLRDALKKLAEEHGVSFVAPAPALCTDNGVMVAWAGLERRRLGHEDGLDTSALPRWPLETLQPLSATADI